MSDLADLIIQANEDDHIRKGAGDQAPDGYYTDDLGYWVEQDIRRDHARFAQYVAFRCRVLNPHIYWDPVELVLFNRHTPIEPTTTSILLLARCPNMITAAQAIWVYNKLKETAPRLDRNRVLVAPGLAWDFEKAELVKLTDKYYTVGGEEDE